VVIALTPKLLVKLNVSSPPTVFFTILIEPCWVFVNAQVTVSPAPNVSDASGGEAVLKVEDPLPDVVIEHDRFVRSQPLGTVSLTVKFPGVRLLNVAATAVPSVTVVIEKFPDPSAGLGNPPVLVKANAPTPPCEIFWMINPASFASVYVQVTVSPAPNVILAGCVVPDAGNVLVPDPVVVSEHTRVVRLQPLGTVSFTVKLPGVTLLNVAATAVPAVDVVMEKFPDPSAGLGNPPVLVKANAPTPP
jgi:hypothetical protein